jgi:predicted MPP superfamily phosphohydrolase
MRIASFLFCLYSSTSLKSKSLRFGAFLTIVLMVIVSLFYFYTHPKIYRIPTESEHLQAISFFALGDQGTGEVTQWLVAAAMEKAAAREGKLDFVVLLGDNFYLNHQLTTDSPEWEQRFERVYSGDYLSTVRFYAVLGNNDYEHGSNYAQLEYAKKGLGSNRWQMPASFYSHDFGMVDGRPLMRVVFLDTNLQGEKLLEQAKFIRERFSKEQGNPIWKVVVGHHTLRSFGKHHKDQGSARSTLLTAMQDVNVDLYLSGHDHNQQVITFDKEPLYIVNGAGGQTSYEQQETSENLRYFSTGHGFAGIKIDTSSLKLDFYDSGAKVVASYSLSRTCHVGKPACLQAVTR